MGVWEFSELRHSCDSSLWLQQDPGPAELPATFPVQFSPGSNIAFPSKNTAMEGNSQGSAHPQMQARFSQGASCQLSLSSAISERGRGKSRGGQGGRERQRERGEAGPAEMETLAKTPVNPSSLGIF